MPDLALVWYTMDDNAIVATRQQASTLAEQLGLVRGIEVTSDTPTAFLAACEQASVSYPGPQGETRTATSQVTSKRPDVITVEVRRDAVRLAQAKYFTVRRTENGIVHGSARVTTRVAGRVDDHDAAGAAMWVANFETAYAKADDQVLSWRVVRRMVGETLTRFGTPMLRRKGLYFMYLEDLAGATTLREFLTRVCDDGDVHVVPVDPVADLRIFLASADEFVAAAAAVLNARLKVHLASNRTLKVGGPDHASLGRTYQEVLAAMKNHQRHLKGTLMSTQYTLIQTRRMMRRLDPTGDLLNVSAR